VLARNQRFNIVTQVKNDTATVNTLDHTINQFADALPIGIHHLCALCFAYLLDDDLLGGLGGDTAE